MGHRAYQIPAFGKTLNARHTAVPDEVELDCSPQDYYGTWARYFDLETDYEQYERELKGRSDTNTYLLAAARTAKGIRILKQELWETILSFIISQNNNIPRIKGCIERLCERFGGFPDAGTIAKRGPKGLDGLGLGYRQDYIIDAAIAYHGDGDGSTERILRLPHIRGAQRYLTTWRGHRPESSELHLPLRAGPQRGVPKGRVDKAD